jgi:hypothetical protein
MKVHRIFLEDGLLPRKLGVVHVLKTKESEFERWPSTRGTYLRRLWSQQRPWLHKDGGSERRLFSREWLGTASKTKRWEEAVIDVSRKSTCCTRRDILVTCPFSAMSSSESRLSVIAPADFHVHLRQGDLCSLVTPHVRQGGFTLAYVMVTLQSSHLISKSHSLKPNLKPPITTTDQALAYKAELEKIDPSIEYLMTLYLSLDLTPEEIRKAKNAGIVG